MPLLQGVLPKTHPRSSPSLCSQEEDTLLHSLSGDLLELHQLLQEDAG